MHNPHIGAISRYKLFQITIITCEKYPKLNLMKKIIQLWNTITSKRNERKLDSQLFLFNSSKKQQLKTPKDFIQEFIPTQEGKINCYRTGVGPVVVFVHGWGGGAYQFFSLMRGLKAIGYTALAFDHLGHGGSENKPATLQQSISITNKIIKYARDNFHDGVSALVGHDTGCLLLANAKPSLIKEISLFLIAPVFNYRLYFLRKLENLKLNRDFIKNYAQKFARNYQEQYAHLELAEKLKPYADYTVIAHDNNDPIASIEDSKKFCTAHPLTKLLVTNNCNHNRIISSESVWHELKSLLNYDDSTINFMQIVADNKD